MLKVSSFQQGLVENGKLLAVFSWEGHRAFCCCVLP